MAAFLTNLGLPELIVILVVAVLIFGKDLPQAASKAYLQLRKLRSAVDDLRRDSGIEREIRSIERTVREAEWEARRQESTPRAPASRAEPSVPRRELPAAGAEGPTPAPPPTPAPGPSPARSDAPAANPAPATGEGRGGAPTDAAS